LDRPLAHLKNETEIKLKQNLNKFVLFQPTTDDSFISVLFQRLAHVKQNAETIIVGVAFRKQL